MPAAIVDENKPDTGRGLKCNRCGGRRWRVYYTRTGQDEIKRVRECLDCQGRVSTKERIVGQPDQREGQQ